MKDTSLTAYDVAAHYDENYFADLSARYRTRNRFARRRIKNVFSLLPEVRGQRVLDIGCGMGTFTFEAATRGAQAIGLDLAPAGIAAAQRIRREEKIGDAHFVRCDAAMLPLRSASADLIIAADVTEHLDDATLAQVMIEAARTLRPGGSLIIYTPAASHIFEQLRDRHLILKQEPSHIGIRSGDELAAAAERAGLRSETVRYLPSHLPLFNVFEQALARWVPLLRRRIGLVARKPS